MSAMLDSHILALEEARGAMDAIDRAAGLVADAFEAGGTLHYAAAGSSGLMALADACELPGTFRMPRSRIRICMAGGVPSDGNMPGDTEDDTAAAIRNADIVRAGDVAIVVSASGTTPYALGFAEVTARKGAHVIGIANAPASALLEMVDVPVALGTVPEVVEGSTRLGAGTAQKAALNMISTRAGILLGHVHDGMMVNLNPENIKLRRRAVDIVSRIAHVTMEDAEHALAQTGYDTKCAALVATGISVGDARALLHRHRGRLRPCLHEMTGQTETTE